MCRRNMLCASVAPSCLRVVRHVLRLDVELQMLRTNAQIVFPFECMQDGVLGHTIKIRESTARGGFGEAGRRRTNGQQGACVGEEPNIQEGSALCAASASLESCCSAF